MSPNKIMFCEDCTLMGVPVPENNDTCGNCGSHNVTVFLPVGGLTQRAVDEACACGIFIPSAQNTVSLICRACGKPPRN